MSDFHNEQVVKKSRREHKCACCNSVIETGSSYVRNFGVWEGHFYTYKLCLVCNEIIKDLFSTGDYEDGVDYEQVLWEINPDKKYFEMLQKIPNKSECLKKLLAGWKEELLEGGAECQK